MVLGDQHSANSLRLQTHLTLAYQEAPLVELPPRKKILLLLLPRKKRRSQLAHGDLVALRLNQLSPPQVSLAVAHHLLLLLPSQLSPLQVLLEVVHHLKLLLLLSQLSPLQDSLAASHLQLLLLLQSQLQQLPHQTKRMRRVMTPGASAEAAAERVLLPKSEKMNICVEVNSSIIYGIYFKVNCK